MWKFVTRGIRESLERRVCRTNVYSQNSDETVSSEKQLQDKQQSKRCFVKELHKELKGPCLLVLAKQHCRHLGSRRKDEQRNYDAKYNWSEAVGWSGVLALGYVVCQSIFIRRNLFELDNANVQKWKQSLIVYPQIQATQLISNFLPSKPQYILPITKDFILNKQTVKQVEDLSDYIEDVSEDTSEDLVDGAVNIEQAYGPITAEQALKQAIDEFSYANEVVLGELEFNSGLLAVEQKRYKDAVHHFASGAKMSSVRSMFNLGLCYELGLGTARDFKKAVKYYAKAAKEGHIDAMYNLGVYFAQGKGGVNINLNAAKHWFKKAAGKGQLKALKALQLEESFKKSSLEQSVNHLKMKTMENTNTNVSSLANYKHTYETSIDSQIESDEYSNLSDNNLSSPSPTDMFLGLIGMHEQNVMPFMAVRENAF